jgi:hypothetical protein
VRSTKTVYIVQYRFQKATQRESLGDVRKLTIEDARKVEPMDDRGEELAREVRKVDADHRHQR